MDLLFAYLIVLLFIVAIVTFAFGLIGPGIALLLVCAALTWFTQG